MLKGIAASAGVGIGKAVLVKDDDIEVVKRAVRSVPAEKQRFLDAVEVFISEIELASAAVSRNVGASEAAILDAQIAIINDPELTKEVLRTIERQQVNVEYAFNSICNGYIALFSNLEDELISARAADFRDIRNRMLCILMGIQKIDLSTVPPGSILVAEDIPPSQASAIDTVKIMGLLTQGGTRFSHIAIIARALQLPSVVAADNLLDTVNDGDMLIVDGYTGCVWVNPPEAKLEEYHQHQMTAAEAKERFKAYRDKPTRTMDGRSILLASNLAVVQELDTIRSNHADGIGLFRTEFLYMDRKKAPNEQEQFEMYRQVTEAMDGKQVIIRTLDVGGDKDIPYLFREREENPFLGYRAVRFCLGHTDLFKIQLTAILRAAAYGDAKIMVPMITCVTELRQVRTLVKEAIEDLEARAIPYGKNVQVGVMIETPAAAIGSEDLAVEADFFSIGTNDLTQYVLAVDRGNGYVAPLYNTMHPAVLRMIHKSVQAGHKAGIPVGICGEAAADPLLIPFLVGLGVEEFSVSSGLILEVRSLINGISHAFWREQIPAILALQTPQEVCDYIRNGLGEM